MPIKFQENACFHRLTPDEVTETPVMLVVREKNGRWRSLSFGAFVGVVSRELRVVNMVLSKTSADVLSQRYSRRQSHGNYREQNAVLVAAFLASRDAAVGARVFSQHLFWCRFSVISPKTTNRIFFVSRTLRIFRHRAVRRMKTN